MKNTMIRLVTGSVLFGLLLVNACLGQGAEPISGQDVIFKRERMMPLWNGHKDFSVEARFEWKEEGKTMVSVERFAQRDGDFRWELDGAKAKGISEEDQQRAQLLGLFPFVYITCERKNVVWHLFPGQKCRIGHDIYPDQFKKDYERFLSKIRKEKPVRKDMGEELIDGRACKKVSFSYPDEPESYTYAWFAKDLKDFPVRLVMPSSHGPITINLSNIDLKKPDKKMFEVPEDYAVFVSSEDVKRVAAMRYRQKTGKTLP